MNQEQEKQPVKKAKSKSKSKAKAKPQSEFPITESTETKPKLQPKAKPQSKRESRTVMTESPITGVNYKTVEVNAKVASKMEAEVVQSEIDTPSTKEYWNQEPIAAIKKEPKEPNDKGRIILFLVVVATVLLAYSYFSK